jgi:hypothetical protein
MISAGAAAIAPKEQALEVLATGFAIPARIALPAGTPKGAILLLPGSLFSDVDGDYPSMGMRPHVYADLAGQLAAAGWASLRMAKIGPGTGSRVVDQDEARRNTTFTARVPQAAEALRLLREAAPNGPAVVAGHSEGALAANLLAAGPRGGEIAGVVSLSGPALRLLDILRGQVAAMGPPMEPPMKPRGAPAPDLSVLDAAIAAIRAGQPLAPEAAHNPETAMMAAMPPASLAYLADVDRVDPLAAVARVRQPMLLVQGGRDDSVTPDQVDALAKARGRSPTTVRRFPGLTHFYKRAPDGLAPQAAMALSTPSDPAVAQAMAAWAARL